MVQFFLFLFFSFAVWATDFPAEDKSSKSHKIHEALQHAETIELLKHFLVKGNLQADTYFSQRPSISSPSLRFFGYIAEEINKNPNAFVEAPNKSKWLALLKKTQGVAFDPSANACIAIVELFDETKENASFLLHEFPIDSHNDLFSAFLREIIKGVNASLLRIYAGCWGIDTKNTYSQQTLENLRKIAKNIGRTHKQKAPDAFVSNMFDVIESTDYLNKHKQDDKVKNHFLSFYRIASSGYLEMRGSDLAERKYVYEAGSYEFQKFGIKKTSIVSVLKDLLVETPQTDEQQGFSSPKSQRPVFTQAPHKRKATTPFEKLAEQIADKISEERLDALEEYLKRTNLLAPGVEQNYQYLSLLQEALQAKANWGSKTAEDLETELAPLITAGSFFSLSKNDADYKDTLLLFYESLRYRENHQDDIYEETIERLGTRSHNFSKTANNVGEELYRLLMDFIGKIEETKAYVARYSTGKINVVKNSGYIAGNLFQAGAQVNSEMNQASVVELSIYYAALDMKVTAIRGFCQKYRLDNAVLNPDECARCSFSHQGVQIEINTGGRAETKFIFLGAEFLGLVFGHKQKYPKYSPNHVPAIIEEANVIQVDEKNRHVILKAEGAQRIENVSRALDYLISREKLAHNLKLPVMIMVSNGYLD